MVALRGGVESQTNNSSPSFFLSSSWIKLYLPLSAFVDTVFSVKRALAGGENKMKFDSPVGPVQRNERNGAFCWHAFMRATQKQSECGIDCKQMWFRETKWFFQVIWTLFTFCTQTPLYLDVGLVWKILWLLFLKGIFHWLDPLQTRAGLIKCEKALVLLHSYECQKLQQETSNADQSLHSTWWCLYP